MEILFYVSFMCSFSHNVFFSSTSFLSSVLLLLSLLLLLLLLLLFLLTEPEHWFRKIYTKSVCVRVHVRVGGRVRLSFSRGTAPLRISTKFDTLPTGVRGFLPQQGTSTPTGAL